MRPSALEAQILDHFQSLMRCVAGSHASEFLGLDLTMSQAKLLYLVSLRPGIGMSALASELEVGLSAVSGLVDRLVAHGYLERREDPDDRRHQRVTATPAGSAALDRMRELRIELMRSLMAGLTSDELSALRDGIAALDREAQHLVVPSPSPVAQTERTPA